jgi:hypothetical protein
VYVTPPQERNRSRAIEKFAFTSIFDEEAVQRDVFVETMVPLLQMCVNGRDGTLATLGVTGSGKVGRFFFIFFKLVLDWNMVANGGGFVDSYYTRE